MLIAADDPSVVALTEAVQRGDVDALRLVLQQRPELASARLGDAVTSREALHVATDWPGHVPNVGTVIDALVAAGADPDARFAGPHRETPLHWAASSDDVEALDALLAAGADIEAGGGVLTDGPPLDDAVIFGQWATARRLVAAGATTGLFHAAALGMEARVAELLAAGIERDELTASLWHACNAGQEVTARQLIVAGADPRWIGWNDRTPIDAAREAGADDLVAFLIERVSA